MNGVLERLAVMAEAMPGARNGFDLQSFGSGLHTLWSFLLTHLWETTLVWCLLLLLSLGLRRAPARLHDVLGWMALAKLLVPFALLQDALRPAGMAAMHGAQAVARQAGWSSPPVSGIDAETWLPAISSVWRSPWPETGPVVSATAWLTHPWVLAVMTAAWVVTALLLLSRVVVSVLVQRAQPREGMSPIASAGPDVHRRLREAVRLASKASSDNPGVHGRVSAELLRALRIGDAPRMPSVDGLWSPRIHLPRDLVYRLDAPALSAILLHEYEHLRRRDPARLLLLRAVSAVWFFFVPLWPLIRRLRTTAELACDEAVVRAGVAPEVLARALAQVLHARLIPEPSRVSLGSGPSQFRRRLAHLNTAERSFGMWKHRFIVGIALLGIAGLGASAAISNSGASDARGSKDGMKTEESANETREAQETKDSATQDTSFAEFDQAPRPIPASVVHPAYPQECRTAGGDGRAFVLVRTLISKDGHVVETSRTFRPGESAPEGECSAFATSALEAVAQWRFEPATLDGEPVQVVIVVPVRFEPESETKDQSLGPVFDPDDEC